MGEKAWGEENNTAAAEQKGLRGGGNFLAFQTAAEEAGTLSRRINSPFFKKKPEQTISPNFDDCFYFFLKKRIFVFVLWEFVEFRTLGCCRRQSTNSIVHLSPPFLLSSHFVPSLVPGRSQYPIFRKLPPQFVTRGAEKEEQKLERRYRGNGSKCIYLNWCGMRQV